MNLRIPWVVVGAVLGALWGGGVVALALTGNARFILALVATSVFGVLCLVDKYA